MRTFKKVNPRQALYLSDGSPLRFEEIDRGTGIYPPAGKGISEAVANEIAACVAGERGGVSEISAEEYNALIEKKKLTLPSKKNWREEFSLGSMVQTDTAGGSRLINQLQSPPPTVAAEAKPPVPAAVASGPPQAAKKQ